MANIGNDKLQVKRQGIVEEFTEHRGEDGKVTGRSSEVDGLLGTYTEHRDENGIVKGFSVKEELSGIEFHRDSNGQLKGATYNDGINKSTRNANGLVHSLQYGEGGSDFANNEQLRGGDMMDLINTSNKSPIESSESMLLSKDFDTSNLNLGEISSSMGFEPSNFNGMKEDETAKKMMNDSGFGMGNSINKGKNGNNITNKAEAFFNTGIFGPEKKKKKTFFDGGIFG